MNTRQRLWCTLILCGLLAATSATRAQDRDQLERRLGSVATLIETSSAARQIEASARCT